jgi:plastocyanin
MNYIKYPFIALVLLLSFSFTAFGEDPRPEVKQDMTSAITPTAELLQHEHSTGKENRIVAAVDTDGVQRVEVLGGEYFFDPNYIVVKVNQPVELKVKKTGGFTPHDIVVKAPDAGINFAESLSTEPKVIKFTPTRVGKYPMYCDKKLPFVKSHRERGMDGMIEVVE